MARVKKLGETQKRHLAHDEAIRQLIVLVPEQDRREFLARLMAYTLNWHMHTRGGWVWSEWFKELWDAAELPVEKEKASGELEARMNELLNQYRPQD